jgi:hypothetical protein
VQSVREQRLSFISPLYFSAILDPESLHFRFVRAAMGLPAPPCRKGGDQRAVLICAPGWVAWGGAAAPLDASWASAAAASEPHGRLLEGDLARGLGGRSAGSRLVLVTTLALSHRR